MSVPTTDEVIDIVSAFFTIKGVNQTPKSLVIEIGDHDLMKRFQAVAQRMEQRNLVASLERDTGATFIVISSFRPPKSRRTWIPRVLFGGTVTTVMIDGYYRAIATNSIAKVGDPLFVAFLYTVSLMGILGIHELGHMIASKRHGIKISWPYFIPGIPIIGFIPTFGALILSRGLIINKNMLFDIGISGPVAGLLVAIAVSTYGAYLSPMISAQEAHTLSSQHGLLEIHSSILMDATIILMHKHVPGEEMIMSPVMLAAWFGFLLTFLNLLPAWQLDGGHVARATVGPRRHRVLTYASIGILAVSGYYIMALFVLALSMRTGDARPLDDISPLSPRRRRMFPFIMVLAFLCAPLPFSLLSQ